MGSQENHLNFDAARFGKSAAWTRLGEKILDAAKQELFLSMRYLFEPLNSLVYRRDPQIAFTATDGRQLYYNPIRLAARYREDPVFVNRAYLHMVLHGLFRNIYHVRGKDRAYWDLACDIMAEYLIDGMDLSCVMRPENPARVQLYQQLEKQCRLMSAENIYEALRGLPAKEQDRLLASGAFLADDHAYWYRQPEEAKQTRTQEEKDNDEQRWEEASRKMQTAMTGFSNGRGDSRGRLRRLLAAGTRRPVNYREFLKKFTVLRESMHVDLDSFDYGFYHYGMSLYGNMPLVEELEYREECKIEDLVIVLDTSGSCGTGLVRQFLETTFDILSDEASFFERMNLHILQCDNQVQTDTVLHSRQEMDQYRDAFQVQGFGGTDFRPAFRYIEDLQKQGALIRLRGVLYFTDGYGIYPEKRPPYDTAFVFLSDYDAGREVPGWAIRVEINEDSLHASR